VDIGQRRLYSARRENHEISGKKNFYKLEHNFCQTQLNINGASFFPVFGTRTGVIFWVDAGFAFGTTARQTLRGLREIFLQQGTTQAY